MIAGAIIAGGNARRLGGVDKCMLEIRGRTILERAISLMHPHVAPLILNANGDPERFRGYGLPVVPDAPPHDRGPLGGLLSAMDWIARTSPSATQLVTVPGDMPFLPSEIVPRLIESAGQEGRIALAATQERIHPLCAAWPLSLRHDLAAWLLTPDNRKVMTWLSRHDVHEVLFDDNAAFLNINTISERDFANAPHSRKRN